MARVILRCFGGILDGQVMEIEDDEPPQPSLAVHHDEPCGRSSGGRRLVAGPFFYYRRDLACGVDGSWTYRLTQFVEDCNNRRLQ